jgi:mono/diheme cytochrome c family protein
MSQSCPHTCSLRALICAALLLAGPPTAFAEDLSTSSGAQLYRQFCASCHGKGGEGDGPVAPFFKLRPPDLTLISRRSGGTFPADRIRRIVDGRENISPHGSREMPIWGVEIAMSDDDPSRGEAAAQSAITRLVEHLRSMQKPASR